MKNVDLQNGLESFLAAVAGAHPADIEFAEEAVPVHSELRDVKVGFRPVKVRGVAVPEEVRAMYVRGKDGEAVYWYVVTWRDCGAVPRCIDAASDEVARALLLDELRKWSLPGACDA